MTSSSGGAGPMRQTGPLELFVSPLRRWRILATAFVATLVVTSVLTFVLPKRYTSNASFVPDEGQSTTLPSNLASLASQFGLPQMGSGSSGPQFYADLIHSRVIVRALLAARVPTSHGVMPVMALLPARDADSARREEKAEDMLRARIGVTFDRVTRRVDVSVWMKEPQTAQATADSLLALVDTFDRDIRRSRAGNKRAFAQQQRAAAADSLRAAETAMANFLDRNRIISSPQLEFERDRLQRAITLRQEIFLALAREAEQARVEEVDTRPVITLIDRPVVPARRSWPPRKKLVVLAVAAVLAPLWIWFVLVELARQQLAVPEGDFARAAAQIRQVWTQVRRRQPPPNL